MRASITAFVPLASGFAAGLPISNVKPPPASGSAMSETAKTVLNNLGMSHLSFWNSQLSSADKTKHAPKVLARKYGDDQNDRRSRYCYCVLSFTASAPFSVAEAAPFTVFFVPFLTAFPV